MNPRYVHPDGFSHAEEIAYSRGYRVTTDGHCTRPDGRVMAGYLRGEYRAVNIGRDVPEVLVHRLQAFQMFGSAIYSQGVNVRHLNEHCLNNAAENIGIGTFSENMHDRSQAKRRRIAGMAGQRHDPSLIRAFFAGCRSYRLTMERFGISSKGTLHYVLNRATNWKGTIS